MKYTSDQYADKKKQVILREAIKLFNRYGYQKTTTADIAGSVGLVKGGLYNYFDSKEEIYLEALKKEMEELRNYTSKFIDPSWPSVNNLMQYFLRTYEQINKNEFLQSFIKGSYPKQSTDLTALIKKYHKEAVETLERIILVGNQDMTFQVDNPRLAAHCLLTQFIAILKLEWDLEDNFSQSETIYFLLETLCSGLSNKRDWRKGHKSPDWWRANR
jgi:AcrR family transcriptional regulator